MMETQIVPVDAVSAGKAVIPESWGVTFLGGLIDLRDVAEGPIGVYTDLQFFQGFRLNENRVGFPGAIGIREEMTLHEGERKLVFHLWPYMPALDTEAGSIDISDPKSTLKLSWRLVPESKASPPRCRVKSIAVEMQAGDIHWKAVLYALKLIVKAKKLWPRVVSKAIA